MTISSPLPLMARQREPVRTRDYVLIVGHGRSGTNWLLDLFDLSPRTHCRNEPYGIDSSPFAQLPSRHFRKQEQPELETMWDEAVRFTAFRMGERDHSVRARKEHLHDTSLRLHLPELLGRRKVRRMLGLAFRSLRASEWLLPRWLGSRGALAQATPVMKFVQAPGWLVWVLEKRPCAQVAHIVRHPGGFLNSWRKRYLSKHDYQSVLAANRARLRSLAESDNTWAERLAHLQQMSADESELWYWRYSTETIHQAGAKSGRYHLVIYEQLVTDTIGTTRRLYQECGLAWCNGIQKAIRTRASGSASIAAAWRTSLSAADLELVARILKGSRMQNWWEG